MGGGSGSGGTSTRERSFEDAVTFGDSKALERMLGKPKLLGGEDANTRLADGSTGMHIAAERGHPAILTLLVQHDGDIDAKDTKGCTPLMAAIMGGAEDSVAFLLKNNADINIANDKGVVPLTCAAETGNIGIMALLVAAGAPVESRDADGRTALMAAAQAGQAILVGSLAGWGASCTATDNKGNTPLHYAAQGADNEVTIRFLLEKKRALLDQPNADGETPMIAAVKSRALDNVRALIELGADPMIADKTGMNATDHARASRRVKFRQAMTEILADQGAAAGRDIRKGTEHQVKVIRPLILKKPKAS